MADEVSREGERGMHKGKTHKFTVILSCPSGLWSPLACAARGCRIETDSAFEHRHNMLFLSGLSRCRGAIRPLRLAVDRRPLSTIHTMKMLNSVCGCQRFAQKG